MATVSNLDYLVKILTETLSIPRERLNDVMDSLAAICNTISPKVFKAKNPVDSLIFNLYYPFMMLLIRNSRNRKIIDFTILVMKHLVDFCNLNPCEKKIFFPVIKLVNVMLENKYNKREVLHVFSNLPNFHDEGNDIYTIKKILAQLSHGELSEDYAFATVNLFLFYQHYIYNYNSCVELLNWFEDSQEIDVFYKKIVAFFVSLGPLLYRLGIISALFNPLTLLILHSAMPRKKEYQLKYLDPKQVILRLKNLITNLSLRIGISPKISSDSQERILKEFLISLYKEIDRENIPPDFTEELFRRIVGHIIYVFYDYRHKISRVLVSPDFNSRVFEAGLVRLLHLIPPYQITKYLDFTFYYIETGPSDDRVRLLPIFIEAIVKIVPLMGKAKAVKILELLKHHPLGIVRERAYTGLYTLTKNDKYLYEAIDDRYARLRKWAESTLKMLNQDDS